MQHTVFLGVNIDHIATLRQARGTRYPSPVYGAMIAQEAGADLITLHRREDERHINAADVRLIKAAIHIPMNFELAVTEDALKFAEEILPERTCLVPERREELTTEGGLDVLSRHEAVALAVKRLQRIDSEVSLFIDPDLSQIDAALSVGANAIELHTGCYADATTPLLQAHELQRIIIAAEYASKLGLIVNAGHGLNYHNVKPIAAITHLRELNIGHAIIAQSIFCGLEKAVKEMRGLMLEARSIT